MGSSKSKAPAAPNYKGLAAEQGVQDRLTAEAITASNRPTQYDGFGNSITWTRNAAGNWTQNVNLSQDILNARNAAAGINQGALDDLANLGAFSSDAAQIEWDPNGWQRSADVRNQAYDARALQQQAQDTAALTNKLRMSGLEPGTEAFDRAMKNQLTSQYDANALAYLNNTTAGQSDYRSDYQAQLAGQNQNYQQDKSTWGSAFDRAGAAAGLQGSQWSPQFQGFGSATGYNAADVAGAGQAQYNAQMGNYSANQSKKGGMASGLGSFAGGAFGK